MYQKNSDALPRNIKFRCLPDVSLKLFMEHQCVLLHYSNFLLEILYFYRKYVRNYLLLVERKY